MTIETGSVPLGEVRARRPPRPADALASDMASRNDNATRPTDVAPADFVAGVEHPTRRADGQALLALMNEVTGEAPAMWGPTMVGYGSYHYRYDSGREGDFLRIGFSPRKASLSLYGLQGPPGAAALLERLGKHKSGVGCLHVNKLADVDMDVLRELVALGWRHPRGT